MSRTIERRITDAKIEVRTNPDGSVGVRGYAAVFDSPAHGEVIKRSAFNVSLARNDNVRFLINHEGTPLASTKSGTMTVGVDDRGLWFDIPSFDMSNPRAQEFCSAVGRGDMYQCSFAGYFNDTPTIEGLREVRAVSLIDVSGVTYPWYEEATMELTGNTRADKTLISQRSAPERREATHLALRTAPPGKTSYGDLACQLCDAISEHLAVGDIEPWVYIDDLGDDWAVYSLWDGDDWDYYQIEYTVTDGVFTLESPFEVEQTWTPMTTKEIAADDAEDGRSYSAAEARALLGI